MYLKSLDNLSHLLFLSLVWRHYFNEKRKLVKDKSTEIEHFPFRISKRPLNEKFFRTPFIAGGMSINIRRDIEMLILRMDVS